MALYPAPSGCRLSVQMITGSNSQEHVNVFHFAKRDSTVMTDQNMQDLIDDFKNNVMGSYRAMFYTDQTGINYFAETLTPEPRTGVTNGGVWNGTRTPDTDWLPPFTSLRVSWDVGYLTRRWQGKTYIGGLREQDQASGLATQGIMDLVQAWTGAMLLRFGTNGASPGFVFCILSDPDHTLPSGVVPVGKRAAQLASVQGSQHTNELTSLRRRAR